MTERLAFTSLQMQAAIYATLAIHHATRVQVNANSIEQMIGDFNLVKPTDRRISSNSAANKLIKDVFQFLLHQSLTEEEILYIAFLVGSGYALHKLEPNLRISGENLEKFRVAVQARSTPTLEGNLIWPPSKQTISAKLGHGTWNDALKVMGFQTVGRELSTYSHKFNKSDFAHAVSEFTLYCAENDRYPSIGAYDSWQAPYGSTRPSSDLVRKHYKSWSAVVRIVQSDLSIFNSRG